MAQVLFKNVNVFDGTTPHLLTGHHVLVEDGLIREVSATPIAGTAETVVDAGGRTLMPGLIDLHVHIWAADLNLSKLVQMPSEFIALFAAGIAAPIPRPVIPVAIESHPNGPMPRGAMKVSALPTTINAKPTAIGIRKPVRRNRNDVTPAIAIVPTARAVRTVPAWTGCRWNRSSA